MVFPVCICDSVCMVYVHRSIKHARILEDTLQNRLDCCSAFSLFLCVSVLLTVTVFPIKFLPEMSPFPSHLGAL